jgi:hypothetical protein
VCGKEFKRRGSQIKRARSCGCLRGVRNDPGITGRNIVLHEYRNGASARGLEFSLSVEQFVSIQAQPCFYCGSEPTRVKVLSKTKSTRSKYVYNGIDRVDNALGYVAGNCVSCCTRCNVSKGPMSQEAFIAMAQAIAAKHPLALEP